MPKKEKDSRLLILIFMIVLISLLINTFFVTSLSMEQNSISKNWEAISYNIMSGSNPPSYLQTELFTHNYFLEKLNSYLNFAYIIELMLIILCILSIIGYNRIESIKE
ncbi:MAG: hypothetical protein MUO82_07430 [Candidatus Thermoplasmatota archaeon]|nr:hypothetical protein [Candidatus Thermoplasmatota archaeon]